MPTFIACPSCQRRLRVPDALLDQRVQCPSCAHLFDATPPPANASPPGSTAEAVPQLPEAELLPPAADHRAACPTCGQSLRRDAVRCPHCGVEFDEDDEAEENFPPAVRHDWEPHRGTAVLVLGILSLASIPACFLLGLPLGIAAWVMGQRDLHKMRTNVMDPRGLAATQAGWICGIIGTLLDCLFLLVCLVLFGLPLALVNRVRPPGTAPAIPVPVQPVPEVPMPADPFPGPPVPP